MKRLKIIITIILFVILPIVGAVHDIRFSKIGIDNGLSHSTVNGISQDHYGYIWVATPDGLNRYDGYEFKTFIPDTVDHNIRAVAADNDGVIWSITARSLSYYSPMSESFTSFTFTNESSLQTLLPISSDEIAVGATDGLYIFRLNDKKFSLISSTKGKDITATAIYNGNMTFGTSDGSVMELEDNRCQMIVKIAGHEINILLQDRNSLLIGTEGDGMFVYDPQHKKAENIGKDIGINYVRSLLIDSQGRLWIGTFSGLYVLDADRKRFVFHENATAADGALSHSSVRRMFSDNNGGIWLGTYYGGLNYYHPLLCQFTTLSKHNLDRLSISGNIAGPIAEDSKGNIWIGTNNGGLNIYNPKTGEFIKRLHKDGLGSDDVKAIFINESEQKAYIGTHIGGLSVISLPGGHITAHPKVAQSVYDILPARRENHLWLAILDGVSLFNTATNEHKRITAPYMPARTTNLLRDNKGRIWISGEDGLAVFTENNDGLTLLSDMPRLTFHVNDVYQSHTTGHLWIATQRGLYRYDDTSGSTTHYGMDEGLPSDIVYAMLEDNNANIWASTNCGLACLNPTTGKIMTYRNRDGLTNSQFTDRSALNATNGLMYFGGINGVTYFNPSIMEKNEFAPTPIIEGLRLFNKPVSPGDETGLLSVGLSETKSLVFNSDQTNFTIDFTVCDYISRGVNTFKYMLDGIDKQWITLPPGVRSVSYSNLPAGKYVFRLNASNNDGLWSKNEASLEIKILPPWYRTWWAILFFVLLILTASFLTTRYIWRRKSLEKLHKARQEVTEMKVRFFVNMSHELRTPLTLMLLPVNELIAAKPDPATLQKLTTVRNNTLRIQHIVNQLLDYRRAELGMFRLGVAKLDINALIGSLIEPYKNLAENKKIRFLFNSTITDPQVYADANYIELIVNNLVTNAFKYTPSGGDINLNLSTDGHCMTLSVSDTGCGIPADKLATIFTRFYQLNDSVGGYGIGLSLVKRLTELHHGSITVESTVGKGSTFIVTIPIESSSYQAGEIVTSSPEKTVRNMDVSALLPINDEIPQIEQDPNDRRKTILVADDNAEILKYLAAALSSDFRVLTAVNGVKAIEMLGADTIDLVISDVMMPDMDGVQLCRAIKRNLRTSHIPVILLSAKADISDRLNGLKVGADDYIAKPFQMEELLAKVHNQIRTRESIIQHYTQNTSAIEPSSVAQNPLDEEFLSKAVKIMSEHIDDSQFTTDEFARQMCMSRSNLHLKMKALTGESTNDFIRRTRLRKASELLKTRRYTVAEVSAIVGYSTPSYFATAFKTFYGYSPSSLLSNN